ncbi:S24 family peptidase [Myroides indicus]|uniref:Phage repressor protein C with HTH and peptisase S24 domain n=1 Tax=Myroides indicus TaxID=1323422 RepID=A0A4R7EM77_9FLAO|nr:S24 family peptidase [Myroides indicus]TDS50720.1 phage repressor protein C with HTH and peptisase S24 domain [Myroides indicus]
MKSIVTKLKQYLEHKEIAISYAEKEIGVSNGTLSKPFKNNTTIKTDTLEKFLNKYSDINPEWLLTGKGEMLKDNYQNTASNTADSSTVPIPLISAGGITHKGSNTVKVVQKNIINGYSIPEFTQRGVEYIIRMSGLSMYPKYNNGDLLGCKSIEDKSFFQWGKIYALDTDQGLMIKRLYPSDKEDHLECHSDNKDYPPFTIHKSSIITMAIVVGVIQLE